MNIVSPLKMQWESRYKKIFPEATWTKKPVLGHDSYLFMWCDQQTIDFINNNSKQGRYSVFVRRYELFSFDLSKVRWDRVDSVIMVNDYLARVFENITGIKPTVIYNGVNPEDWTYSERTHGNKIAWVGFINQKKNMPLAFQVMQALPKRYELHIAGADQDTQTMMYMDNLALDSRINVYWSGQVENMDEWLEDKNYILSTAISEGCPNHVIEAMAKGIKPIVHNWPGSKEQFGRHVFNDVYQAISLLEGSYISKEYRSIVEEKFGLLNYEMVKEMVCPVSLSV